MNLEQKYQELPEWSRWILCWPASFLFSGVVWFVFYFGARMVGAFEVVLKILHPATFQAFLLVSLYFLVPRAKFPIVIVAFILRSLFLLFFIVQIAVMLFAYFGIISGIAVPFEPVDKTWIVQVIGEVVTLICSIGVLRWLHSEGEDLQTQPRIRNKMVRNGME